MTDEIGYQINLFGPTPKYQAHSQTSKDAAREIERSAATFRGMVYRALCESDGLTDDEMQQILNMNPSTQRPRRIELVEKGLVKHSGETRKTRSGRKAAVWVRT